MRRRPVLNDPEKQKPNDAIAEVLARIDPSLIGVVEGPASTVAEPVGKRSGTLRRSEACITWRAPLSRRPDIAASLHY